MEEEENLTQIDPVSPQEFAAKIKSKYPQYKDMDDIELSQRIVDKYPQYKSQVSFDLKKKDTSNSSSPNQNSVSETLDGSSDISNFQTEGQSIYIYKNIQQIASSPEFKQNVSDTQKRLLDEFRTSTQLTEDDNAEIESRLKKEDEQSGFWNTLRRGAVDVGNTFIRGMNAIGTFGLAQTPKMTKREPFQEEIREVKSKALSDKEDLNDEVLLTKAKELFVEKQKQNIFNDKAASFLETIPDGDRVLLEGYSKKEIDRLSADNQNKLKNNKVLQKDFMERYQEYLPIKNQLEEYYRNGEQPPENLLQQGVSYEKELQDIGGVIEKNYNDISNNVDDLGTAEEEFDLFKREYSDFQNFAGNIGATTYELGVGLVDFFGMYGGGPGVPTTIPNYDILEFTNKERERIEEARGRLRKPVDEIESWNGFLNYTQDLVANQLPILAATSTGYGGLAVIGASTAGQKASEIQNEVLSGESEYNPLQMYSVPLLYGGAEALGEIPTLSIINRGKRVLTAAGRQSGSQLFKKSITDRAKSFAKEFGIDMSREMAGEQLTNFAQNFSDKYILGKNDVELLDNAEKVFRDTFTLTAILKTSPHIAGAVISPFQTKSQTEKLDENSRKIIELSNQLNIEGITDAEKGAIQDQIQRITQDSSLIMDSSIENIGEMPEELYNEVLRLNKRAGELKQQAKEIYVNGRSRDKNSLIKGIEDEFHGIQEQRNRIINGEVSVIDVLPLSEQERLKREASDQLIKELNPDGNKDITITDEQITERANDIYQSAKEETTQTNQETQPQTEEQTEGGKVDVTEKSQVNLPNQTDNSQQNSSETEVNLPNNEGNQANEGNKPFVRQYKTSPKGKDYTVNFENNELKVTDNTGKEPSRKTKNKILEKYADDIDFTQGETAPIGTNEGDNSNRNIAENSKNPAEVAEAISNINTDDALNNLDYKTRIIAENIGSKSIEKSSFIEHGDSNYINQSIALQYFSKKGEGKPLDTFVEELSEESGVEITPQDVVDFIVEHSTGAESFLNSVKNADLDNLKSQFTSLTGLPANDKFIKKAIDQQIAKDEYLNNYATGLDFMSDEELLSLTQDYGKLQEENTDNPGNEISTQAENSQENSGRSGVQEVRGPENTGSQQNKINLSKDLGLDATKNWLDDIEKRLDDFGKETLGIHIPIAVAKVAITAMKAAVQTAKTTADIISVGINAIKNTDWYKQLSDKRKNEINENSFQSLLASSIKTLNEYTDKLNDIQKRLKESKISKEKAFEEISDFLKNNKINGDVTATEINNLIKKASRILIAKNPDNAMSDFIDTYLKTQRKAKRRGLTNRRKNATPDGKHVETTVKNMISSGMDLDKILDFFDTPRERKLAENIYNRETSQGITEDEAYEEVKKTFNQARDVISNPKQTRDVIKQAVRNLIHKFTDRQFISKKLVGESGMRRTKNLMINSHGASGKARFLFEKSYNKIYRGLNSHDRNILDEIIQSKRFIAIDENRSKRGLPPVTHPNFIDKNKSELFLTKLEKEIGSEKFKGLNYRAEEYFKVYKQLLSEMRDNGLISKEVYDTLNDVDYQPRLFVKHITDFDEDLSDGQANRLKSDSGGLSKQQIQSLTEGDASSLVLNSQWLLSTSINSRYRAMAMNNVNKRFIKDEFPKAKKRYEDLLAKKNGGNKLTPEDIRFLKYFKELDSKIINNPITGTKKTGTPKFKYNKTPKNFKKAYYYENGARNEFFIEDRLHDVWYDNLDGFLGKNAKEFISYASGSALVKSFATGNNPAFAIVNTPRDFMFNVVFSDQYSKIVPVAMMQVAKDTFKALSEIRQSKKNIGNTSLEKYIEYGGAMDFLSTQGQLKKGTILSNTINKLISPRAKDNGKRIFNAFTLSKISNYSEVMFRLALFQRSINNQLKDLGYKSINEIKDQKIVDDIYNEGVSNARSLLDFNQGGSITKDLESLMPYINTAVQGSRVAFDQFSKDPIGTTSRILQAATIISSATAGLSLALISANKEDDDEGKSSLEIYNDAMSGISMYQRAQYMNIVTGAKKDGEYRVIKIAKNQQLAPILSISDNITTNIIRSISGKDPIKSDEVLNETLFAFNNNIMPIDITSPSDAIVRTPITKGILTYATGYDFFREQPLTGDINKVPKEVEGINYSSVEEFYKDIGEKYGLSPARTKGFIESLITTPNTNPFVGLLYGGVDAVTSDKDMKAIGKDLSESVYKSTGKRIVSYTSDFNRTLNEKKGLKNRIEKMEADKIRQKTANNKKIREYISGQINEEELMETLKEFDSFDDKKNFINKIKDRIKNQSLDPLILDIKYERSPEAKALMIMHYYGDVFDGSDDSKKVLTQMNKAKGIWTDRVKREYIKLREN